MKVTRKDVARMAKVSEQTVSYILNNKRKFSQEITDRVLKVVDELNYQPDMVAKSMSTKKTRSMCIAVNDISNPLFGEIIKAFEKSATKSGYFINIMDVHSDFIDYASSLVARRVEGVYVSLIPSQSTEQFVECLIDSDVKVVVGDNCFKGNRKIYDRAVVIDVNHRQGILKILEYLMSKNHKDIVYLSGLDKNSSMDCRYSAFVSHYENLFGLQPKIVENTFPYETDVEDGYRLMKEVFDKNIPCTAVVATNDLMAYGAIECINNKGLKVGEDIAVVGIDDISFSRHVNPPLTTLGFDKKEYGKLIFESLKSYIETEQRPEGHSLDCELIVRKST